VDRRVREKERIGCAVIDGRLTLFEAAALFRRLNEAPPKPAPLSASFPGDSEEERLCRQVIRWAWRRLSECYPGGAEALVAPYEEELRRHKERHGRVVLPDVTEGGCY
jgi:glutathione S-transferase